MTITMTLLGSAVAVAGVAAISCWVTRALFLRFALLDRPGAEAHKQQHRAVPYGGGGGILLALAVWLAVGIAGWPLPLPIAAPWTWLGLGVLLLFLLGQIDDLFPMRARWKFVSQTVICSIVVIGSGLRIDALQDWPILAQGVAIFWLLTVCNAFNLLDHGDGVSAGTGMISAGVLMAAAITGNNVTAAAVYSALIGALAGFLVWNRPPARLYMGDAGSLPLGFLIGAGTLVVSFAPPAMADHVRWPVTLLAPLLITAVPIYDMTVVIFKRYRRKKPLFRGDLNHISHRLARLGLPARSRLAVTVSLHLALAGSALLLRTATPTQMSTILAQTAAILLAVLLLEATRDHG